MNNEIIIFHRPNIRPEKYEEPIYINFDVDNIICPIKVQKSRYKKECNLKKDPDIAIRINLPKIDGVVKWRDAVSSISKYFTPYSIGDVVKMNLDTFTYKIRLSEFIPIYYIARKLNITTLYHYIEMSIDSGQIKPYQIANLYLDSKDKLKQISFPEIISHFELVLEMSPPLDIYMKSLHFANIVLNIQKQRQNREFIRKWLHNVYKEFDKTKLYFNQIFKIVSNHQIVNGNDAFIIWVYSQHFPSMNNTKKFASILNSYEFSEEDTKIPLTEAQAVWFFENRNKKESINPSIIKLVVPYVCALSKTDPTKCFQMFQNLIASINSVPEVKDNLTFDQLIQLLFLAAHPPNSADVPFYQNIYDQISEEIHQKAESNQNYNEYIFDNHKEIMKLSWNQLYSTFNFCEKDIFIEICYKWLIKNQKFEKDELDQFYSLFPFDEKEQKWKVRYTYILFRIFNLLNQNYKFNLISSDDTSKFFEGKGDASLDQLFTYILAKNKIFQISPETLNIIHQNVHLNKKEQILFVSLIKNFQIQDFDKKILFPVYEDSLENVINLLIFLKQKEDEKSQNSKDQSNSSNYETDYVIDSVTNISRKYFGKMKISTIEALSKLIPFNIFFGQKSDDIELLNEDRVALYASLSDEFDPRLINFPQLSFRLVSFYFEALDFQFTRPENSPIFSFKKKSFLNSPSMMKYSINIKNEWMKVSIPRFHFHEIGMVSVCVMAVESERTVELIKRSFEFIGIQNVNIIFPSEDCKAIPEDNPVIIVKPFYDNIDCPLEPMVNSFLSRNQPLAMNANSFFSLMNESSDLFTLNELLKFETDSMEKIEWSDPSSEFLPFKENLPILDFKQLPSNNNYLSENNDYSPNADVYYHSISCKLSRDLSKKVTFANGRLFAAKIQPMFSLFNYDIFIEGDEQNSVYWACLKQMALTTLSFFFDFRLKYFNDSS